MFFEGDLRPGNSPDALLFEGSVVLGTGAETHFELDGQEAGLFDQLLIAGDLSLGGHLKVDLIDGFQLSANQQFLIADVGSQLSGQFASLGEGDLVGSFGGRDLFITCSGLGGNGGVGCLRPCRNQEPDALYMLALAMMGVWTWRKRANIAGA